MSARSAASQARFRRAFPYVVRASVETGFDWDDGPAQLIEWCCENCRGRFATPRDPQFVGVGGGGKDIGFSIFRVSFTDDRDATLFKMFWGAEG